ncbi:MAG: hypothetical protein ACO3JT_05660 [Candidatus Nanopelagicales bacterium]|jgi:hypothetical protein
MRFLPTSIASVLVVAATSLALAAPASAVERGVVYDGDDPGPGYTPLEALGIFVGIPALTIVIIVLAVYGPGWAKGRGGTTAGDEGPLWLSSPAGTMAAPSGPGMITPGGPTDHEERGGASARW